MRTTSQKCVQRFQPPVQLSHGRLYFSHPPLFGDEYYYSIIISRAINKLFQRCFFQGRDLSSVLKGVEEGLVFLRFLRFLSVRGGEGKNIDCPGAEENYRALISEALIRKDRDKRRKFLSKLSPFRHPPRDGNFYAIFRLPSRQAHPLSHPPLKGQQEGKGKVYLSWIPFFPLTTTPISGEKTFLTGSRYPYFFYSFQKNQEERREGRKGNPRNLVFLPNDISIRQFENLQRRFENLPRSLYLFSSAFVSRFFSRRVES